MNIKQIELALDLSRTLSYRKTAENRFISQPALTHQIKSLEAEVGVALFHRSSQGVSLTPAGALFCRDMEQISRRIHDTLTSVRNCGGSFSDTLRIGINPRHSLAFPEIIRRFSDAYPGILVDLYQSHTISRLDNFLRKELDLVLFVSDAFAAAANVTHRLLNESRIYCVVRRDHPLAEKVLITAEDLTGRHLLFSGKACPAPLFHAQQHLMDTARVSGRLCPDIDTALLWVDTLSGAALMPGFCYRPDERFVWVPYDWPQVIPCSIAKHADDHRPHVQAFMDIACTVFAENAACPGAIV